MIVLKGKIERLQGWRAFVRVTFLDGKEIAPWCFELPHHLPSADSPLSAGDEIELRIGKSNVDVNDPTT